MFVYFSLKRLGTTKQRGFKRGSEQFVQRCSLTLVMIETDNVFEFKILKAANY